MADTLAVPDGTDLAALESLALEVARACGRLIVDERPADLGVAATKSSQTDVVTVMDRRSEQLARELLSRARPEDGFHGEEDSRVPTRSGITWVVDPIDATVNYLYGIPTYAVSVAAVVGDAGTPGAWRPVAGAVVDPVAQEAHVAHEGGGARLVTPAGERVLTVQGPDELGQALVGTGFGYEADVRREQGRVVAELLPLVRDIRRRGSAALDLCWVADGRMDAYYERGLHEWDLAAGWLVVTEAGGAVRGVAGSAPANPFTLAGSASLVGRLDDLLTRLTTSG